ncbi:MAG: molybdopterin adenylyltransferase [Herbinix sp.]|nr:molybdopterin adenylyltransferase [Herbinix sp.]
MYRVGIITASDKGSTGDRQDISGEKIRTIVEEHGYEVSFYQVLPDEKLILQNTMQQLCDENRVDLLLTTGGTGFSMRDVTPEATIAIAERMVPGIAEAIRAYSMTITKRAMLSRGVAAIRKGTLIINLPGSPKAVEESLNYIVEEIKHGLEILKGEASECAR